MHQAAVFKAWIMEKSQNNQKKGGKGLKPVIDERSSKQDFRLMFFFTTIRTCSFDLNGNQNNCLQPVIGTRLLYVSVKS